MAFLWDNGTKKTTATVKHKSVCCHFSSDNSLGSLMTLANVGELTGKWHCYPRVYIIISANWLAVRI